MLDKQGFLHCKGGLGGLVTMHFFTAVTVGRRCSAVLLLAGSSALAPGSHIGANV